MRDTLWRGLAAVSLASVVSLVAACGDDDAGTPDTGPGDSGRIDLGPTPPTPVPPTPPTPPVPPPPPTDAGSDAEPGDADVDAEPGDADVDAAPDADVDADVDAGPTGCSQVTEDLRAARNEASFCERSTECATRLTATCPEGGCHLYFTTGYFLDDIASLEEEYNALDCGAGAVCRCAPPPTVYSCNDGTCGECPATRAECPYTCAIDCECYVDACGCDQPFCATATCEELNDRMQEAAYDMSGCTKDEDCVIEGSPICPELGCYLARHVGSSRAQLEALVAAYTAQGCGGAVCACTPPPERARCNAGTCEGVL